MLYSSAMRAFRSPLSWLLVIALSFSQLATAYACEQGAVRDVDDNVVQVSHQTAMDCDEMQRDRFAVPGSSHAALRGSLYARAASQD